MKLSNNIVLNTDSYKVSMYKQYPPGTEYVYSYAESRGGDLPQTIFFGLQAFIKEYLEKPVTAQDVAIADEYWTAHGMEFNREGWDYIVNELGGKLPIELRAVPEGTRVPTGSPLVTIVNTDPKCFWLTTWMETALLRAIWYPTTVATQSNYLRCAILDALEESGDPAGIDFKLHDFGARGASSLETAAAGGAAHLVSFMGTDTMSGALFAREYYNEPMAGFSIPATEHSTMTSWGRENEADAYRNMIRQYGGNNPVIAVVSDSYNIFNAAEKIWGEELKQEVIDSGSTLVVRPDSGDPQYVVMTLLETLGNKFGYELNDKGFKVLNNVRLIQGDGVCREVIIKIMNSMMQKGWSIDNIAFGMGGALLQKVDRDTQKFALKCSAIFREGRWQDVMKDPVTDKGKVSKAGRVVATDTGYGYVGDANDIMQTVYRDGELLIETTFAEVRERAQAA